MSSSEKIEIKNIDHLGIVAGIIDEIGIVKIINEKLGVDEREKISSGGVVKAMILNGLGMVSKPLYLFSKFYQDKPVEKLLGKGIKEEMLNDDKIGRVMDEIYKKGLTNIFILIVLEVIKKFKIKTEFAHLDSTSFHLHGEYKSEEKKEEKEEIIKEREIIITRGYSRDHRPDLKQCVLDLIVSNDNSMPLLMRTGDGNEADKSVFAKILLEFKKQIEIERNKKKAGRFILATNVLETEKLNPAEILLNYKNQQGCEQGFRFLKDPMFFADSFFVETPSRVETILWIMSLCLLVYNLGQRELRNTLKRTNNYVKNQVGKLINNPTLRWIFQCFQGIHYLSINGVKQVINLTKERSFILEFLPSSCQKYYL